MNTECCNKSIYINDSVWNIKFISREEMIKIAKDTDDRYTAGLTEYSSQTIYICNEVANIKRVLIHELTHAWQDAYGHYQFAKQYDCEDVCEIVASIYNFLENLNKEERLW